MLHEIFGSPNRYWFDLIWEKGFVCLFKKGISYEFGIISAAYLSTWAPTFVGPYCKKRIKNKLSVQLGVCVFYCVKCMTTRSPYCKHMVTTSNSWEHCSGCLSNSSTKCPWKTEQKPRRDCVAPSEVLSWLCSNGLNFFWHQTTGIAVPVTA